MAQRETARGRLDAMAGKVDDLVASIARYALHRPTEARILNAVNVDVEAAPSTPRRVMGRRDMPVT